MVNTLMFMIYPNFEGDNIVLSPRLSYGRVEPSFSPSIMVSLLEGSSISDDRMLANAVCHDCRKWEGGSIDSANMHTPFIFANGPYKSFGSNSVSISIPMHCEYGSFTMDLTQAIGPAWIPDVPTSISVGTTLETDVQFDYGMKFLHFIAMVLSFLTSMPSGILYADPQRNYLCHGGWEIMSIGVAVFGVYAGLYSSGYYNRVSTASESFTKSRY